MAQNYHAIEGSPYAGSIGVANNPASILATPYSWDVVPFSVQAKNATNAIVFHNWWLLPTTDSIGYNWTPGYRKRWAAVDYNVHLFNARIALSRTQAIAFGANFRGYTVAKTGQFNYNDSLQDMNQFFNINRSTTYNANAVSSSWLELFGTYSRTIWDNTASRLNAGVTLKLQRGLSGVFAQLNGGSVRRAAQGTQTIYYLDAGSAQYGYSSNYDQWHDNNSTWQNIKNMVKSANAGASIDLGVEYWIKSGAPKVYTDKENDDDYYDYEWKIGVSLLDLGANMYKFGTQSRRASGPKTNASDSSLNAKFDNVGSLAEFNDSLATIVDNIGQLQGTYRIYNPARLVINVDRPLFDNFSINANLSFNITPANGGKYLLAKDMNLLSVTPRWETRSLGAYMPVMINRYGKLWVGGAIKAGPLLFGIHNLGTLVSKNKMQNGGLYLAFIIHPGRGMTRDKTDKRLDCPPN